MTKETPINQPASSPLESRLWKEPFLQEIEQLLIWANPDEIVVEERLRKDFDPDAMETLKSSIVKTGQLMPIVCRRGEGEELVLVAGERRLRACKDLRRKVLVVIRGPGGYQEQDHWSKLAELTENLARMDLTPQERVLGLQEIHRLKSSTESDWTLEKTAALVGLKSKGQVSSMLKAAVLLPHVPEMEKAPTMSELSKIVKRVENQVEWQSEVAKAQEESDTQFLETPEEDRISAHIQARIKYYDKNLVLGDALKNLEELREGSINLAFFDPPWGVRVTQMYEDMPSRPELLQTFSDEEEDFKEAFPRLVQELFRVLAPDSHLYCFFGIVHHEFVYSTLSKVGFQVNRRPIIWIKEGAHATRTPDIWPGAAYEPIAFCRKGQRSLVARGKPDYIIHKPVLGHSPNERGYHPSAKPPEIYEILLRRSVHPGDTVLDPMFGTGAAFIACEELRDLHLNWIGFEEREDYRTFAFRKLLTKLKEKL